MKHPLTLFSLLTAFLLDSAGAKDPPYQFVNCGSEKIVIYDGTVSPDGLYAVGWTIRPRRIGAAPVDWSTLPPNREDIWPSFLDRYPFPIDSTDAPYDLVNGFVNIKGKSFLVIRTCDYYPNKNHGNLDVIWSPKYDGRRYAIIQNDGRFNTWNLLLVTIKPETTRWVDLNQKLTDAAERLLKKKQADNEYQFCFSFPLRHDPNDPDNSARDAYFTSASVTIPIFGQVPKKDIKPIYAIATIRLADGKLLDIKKQQ